MTESIRTGRVYCDACGNDVHAGPCDPAALKAMAGPMGPFLKTLLAANETRPPGQATRDIPRSDR